MDTERHRCLFYFKELAHMIAGTDKSGICTANW